MADSASADGSAPGTQDHSTDGQQQAQRRQRQGGVAQRARTGRGRPRPVPPGHEPAPQRQRQRLVQEGRRGRDVEGQQRRAGGRRGGEPDAGVGERGLARGGVRHGSAASNWERRPSAMSFTSALCLVTARCGESGAVAGAARRDGRVDVRGSGAWRTSMPAGATTDAASGWPLGRSGSPAARLMERPGRNRVSPETGPRSSASRCAAHAAGLRSAGGCSPRPAPPR